MEGLIFRKQIVFLLFLALLIAGFFFCAFAQNDSNNPPSALNYAPNFQFDSDEKYYPADPLDFYFVNGEEIEGEEARVKYYNLSEEVKTDNIVVFYHIEDEGNHWVYQYWTFYVFNDYHRGVKNKHYGDWEAVFVFVDKNSKEVIKTIGTAHQRRAFDTEIVNPKTNHIWAYIGEGSHATCVDEKSDGYCNFAKWRRWEKWDGNGHKILHSDYKLKEITFDFISNFKGLLSFKKSSTLGINLFDIIKINQKEFYIPIGGSPPNHPWAQSMYNNPEEARPYSVKYAWEKIKKAGSGIAGFFGGLADKVGNLFKKSATLQPAGIGGVLIDESFDIVPDNNLETNSEVEPPNVIFVEEDIVLPKEQLAPIVIKKVEEKPIEPINVPKKEPIVVEKEVVEEEKELIVQNKPPFGLPFFIGGGPPPPESEPEPETEAETGSESETEPETETVSVPAPAVTSHSSEDIFGPDDDYSTSTAGFQINLVGTSTPNFLIHISASSTSATTTTDINGDWSKVINLEEGINNITVKAEDTDSNESENTDLELIVDTTPPSDIIDLSAVSGDVRGAINLSWTAPGDDESVGASAEYIIRYATSSAITADNWALSTDITSEPTPSIASTTENLIITDLTPGETYHWAIKSEDEIGNTSGLSNCAFSSPSAIAESVIINEIQLGQNEFVELYNPTDSDVVMTGWYWSYYSSKRDWDYPYRNKPFPAGAIIPAGGYYLVGLSGYPEDGDLISADWQVYASQQLNYQKGSVAIFSANPATTTPEKAKEGLVDAIGWGNVNHVYETATTLAATRYKTIVRRIDGWDTGDNSADFTESEWPTPQNSQGEKVAIIADDFVFSQNTTWTQSDAVYILISNASAYPTVQSGAILTIEPGVTVKGYNKSYPSLIIRGTLKAEGTSANPITFTAATTTQLAGDWSGIVFDNSTSSDSVLEYANFEYGGYQVSYGGDNQIKEMVKIDNSFVAISNSSFNNSLHNGIRLVSSSSTIADSAFEDNNSTGIIIDGGSPSISNCEFNSNNGAGVKIINQAAPTIDNNTFSANNQPITLKSAYPAISNNTTNNNTLNGVIVEQGSVFSQNASWTNNLPYILYSGSNDFPTVASGTTLTLETGVIIKPSNKHYTALLIEGNLIAQGASDAPIVFTSLKDDEYGGDTNNDGDVIPTTAPAAEDWKNIQFAAGSEGGLDYVHFRYGGYNTGDILDIDPLSNVTSNNITYYP